MQELSEIFSETERAELSLRLDGRGACPHIGSYGLLLKTDD